MATRSERYLFEQDPSKSRVARNQELYESIYAEDSYFQGVEKPSTIEKTNEIDIEKVKELLKGREIYRRELKMRELNMINSEDLAEKPVEEEEEEKSYDINAYLNKATSERVSEPYHKINPDILSAPVLEKEEKVEEPSLADLKEMGTTELSLDMFGNLSATGEIEPEDEDEEEYEDEDEDDEEDTETELVATVTKTDTFFTDSVKLRLSDEEEDEDEDSDEKSSPLIKIIMVLLVLVIIALIVFVIVM